MDWLKYASYLKKLGIAILNSLLVLFFLPLLAVGVWREAGEGGGRSAVILSGSSHLMGKIPFPLCGNKGTPGRLGLLWAILPHPHSQ